MKARALSSRAVHMERHAETPLLAPSQHRQLRLQDPQATDTVYLKLRWKNRSHGDCIHLRDLSSSAPNQDAVVWSHQAQDPRKMTFSGVRLLPGSVHWCVDVVAPRAVFPVPALAVVRGSLFGYLLDEAGLVWGVELVELNGGVMRGKGLRKEGRSEGSVLGPLGFSEKLGGLKEVVFWGSCGGCLCVGGSSGGALALELGVVHGERSQGGKLPVELWEGYIRRVITTVLRGGMLGPGLVSAAVIERGSRTGEEALALVYEDGSIRVHDVVKNELLAVHNLGLAEGNMPAGVAYCRSENCLVIQLSGTESGVTLLDVVLNGRRVELSSRKVVYRRFPEEALITAAVKWKGCMWLCLTGTNLSSELVLIDDGQSVAWIEDHPHIQRGRSEIELHHQAALWHQIVEDASKVKYNELNLMDYSLGKIMTVGPLSYEALKDALQDAAVNFTLEDWAASNSGRISKLLEAAASNIQTRNPSFTPIVCHWSVVQMYFAKWMRRHMPVKLILSSDQSSLLVVRAGCVISVVREMSPMETWIEDVKVVMENGVDVITDPVHDLIKTVLLLRKALGNLVLDSCSSAVLRGADASQDAIPSAVRAILNPILKEDGERPGQDRWNSKRRLLLFELDGILKKIAPNLDDAVKRLCDLGFSTQENEDMDIDTTTALLPLGVAGFATNALRQISFSRQHLLSGVAVVLGLGLSTTKVLMLDCEYGSHSTQRILGCWTRSAVLHGLCSIPSIVTGMNVSTQATAGEEILSKREENRCQADAFVSAGHVIAADFLEGENNQGGGASTVFSSVLNIVVNKFIDYADGTQGFEQESKGFTLRLCQFAIMFFVKGRWQAVDYLGQVSMSSKEDAALNLIIDLSMSTKIWSLKNEECKKESEEQAAEHIARCVEGLRIESHVDGAMENLIHSLRSSFTSARTVSGELSAEVTYLETMVFVLDYVNAHMAASQVAQVAIGIISKTSTNEDLRRLQRQLWEQVFHHSCACCNFALAFAALSENAAVAEEGGTFNIKALIFSMYKTGRIDDLLSFPFSSVQFSVVAALEELASSVSINDNPHPFEILYQWYYRAADYQSSAESLVGYARRVGQEAISKPGAVKMIYASIVRAVLVLGLCDERDRWVKDPQKLQNGQLLGITSLAELQREHAKLAALIEVLACTGEESCNGIPTCKWVVQELLKLGKFEYVLKNIPYLFKDSEQPEARRNALSYIAVECVKQTRDEKRGGEELHTQSDSLFLNLRGWLEEYDTHDTGCALRFTVAEKILQSAKEMYLPQWLIEMCRERGCDGNSEVKNIWPLIALLHHYGHLDLAVELLIDEARYASHWLHMNNSLHPPQQYMAVRLIKLLRRDLLKRNYQGLVQELDQSLLTLFQLQRKWN